VLDEHDHTLMGSISKSDLILAIAERSKAGGTEGKTK
jgi:hypothetical protein